MFFFRKETTDFKYTRSSAFIKTNCEMKQKNIHFPPEYISQNSHTITQQRWKREGTQYKKTVFFDVIKEDEQQSQQQQQQIFRLFYCWWLLRSNVCSGISANSKKLPKIAVIHVGKHSITINNIKHRCYVFFLCSLNGFVSKTQLNGYGYGYGISGKSARNFHNISSIEI